MKKVSILGFILGMTMLISACSGGSLSTTTPEAGGSIAPSSTGLVGTESVSGAINTPESVSGTPAATGTSVAGIPVTGVNSPKGMLRATDLIGFSVVDRNGMNIGTVQDLTLDIRNAPVCNPSPAAVGAISATPSATTSLSSTPEVNATGTVDASTSAGSSCEVAKQPQSNGLVNYLVVNVSGALQATPASSAMSATPSTGSTVGAESAMPSIYATEVSTLPAAGSSVSTPISGNLMPVPWNVISINLDQHQVVINASASAFSNAPTFSSDNWPDLTSPDWNARLNDFWMNIATGAEPIPSKTATP